MMTITLALPFIIFYLAFRNWRLAVKGNERRSLISDPGYLRRDRIYRKLFIASILLLVITSVNKCVGQSVFVSFNQRYQATVAIDTVALSATITFPNDSTVVLYGQRIVTHNGLILLVEGERTLARICTSQDCITYPQATWCATCGNQRRKQ